MILTFKNLLLISVLFVYGCQERRENKTLSISIEKIKPENDLDLIEIDTTLLFNVWSMDRTAPHADFILEKDFFMTTEGVYNYSLNDNVISVTFPDYKLEGLIKHISKDTLKIKWKENISATEYLNYIDGF